MTISRQKLYSLGEPFGDSATERKLDGSYVCGGGGGKGSAPAKPADPTPVPRAQSPEEQAAVENTREAERRRRAAATGISSTVMTGGQGATGTASTAAASLQPAGQAGGKTMLGQ